MNLGHTSSLYQVGQAGISLSNVIARLGALLVIAGVIELLAITVSPTKTQLPSPAHTEEYARNKMTQLLASCAGGHSGRAAMASPAEPPGLAGCTERNAPRVPATAGSLDAATPVAHYVDYLDGDGNPIAPTTQWQYVRVWQISVPPGGSPGTKQIAVKAQARLRGANGLAPASTIVTTRSFPLK
jgi:hypothetical protein